MPSNLHFISGLPRSGSTLLSAILRQNPRFRAGISSPLASIISAAQTAFSPRNEFHEQMSDAARLRVLRGIFLNYYGESLDNNIVFDTNRGWSGKMSLIDRLFPEAVIICCVRNVVWILDSIERLHQRNNLAPPKMFGFDAQDNIFSRVNRLMSEKGVVGAPFNTLRQAYFGVQYGNLILVTYESLAIRPEATISRIYDLLGEEAYDHDFDSVNHDEERFDRQIGLNGLHTVRSQVSYQPRDCVLPPELQDRFTNSAFWLNKNYSAAGVEVI